MPVTDLQLADAMYNSMIYEIDSGYNPVEKARAGEAAFNFIYQMYIQDCACDNNTLGTRLDRAVRTIIARAQITNQSNIESALRYIHKVSELMAKVRAMAGDDNIIIFKLAIDRIKAKHLQEPARPKFF
jgi:hypothetical protein